MEGEDAVQTRSRDGYAKPAKEELIVPSAERMLREMEDLIRQRR